MNDTTHAVLELGLFHLKDGVTRDEFLAAVGPTSEWAREQPGFVSRELIEADEGRWVEIVWWESLGDAEAAAAASYTSDRCLPLFAKIDMDNLVFLHGRHAIEPVMRSD